MRTPAGPATSSSSSETTTAIPICSFRPPILPGRPTTGTAATAFTSAAPAGRAYKVSYNRPFTTRGRSRGLGLQRGISDGSLAGGQRLRRELFDRHRHRPPRPRCSNHKAFLSVGHDEYWSGAQRANVEAARDGGVNLAFFSGNEVFWKTRWENSIDGPARLTGRSSPTRRRTPTRRSIRYRTSGQGPGAIRDSAHRPTAAGRRTR